MTVNKHIQIGFVWEEGPIHRNRSVALLLNQPRFRLRQRRGLATRLTIAFWSWTAWHDSHWTWWWA